MTARDFLTRGINLQDETKAILDKINSLRDLSIASAQMSHTGAKVSGKKDRMCEIVYDVLCLYNEYEARALELVEIQREIRRTIAKVEDNCYRLLLTLRYENFKSWREIAAEMKYSYQYVHKLHNKALQCVVLCENYSDIA